MAESAQAPEMQRTFIALDLPMAIQQGLAAWALTAFTEPALRTVRPEALHVTLSFLGASDPGRVKRLVAVVDALAVEPVRLAFRPELTARPRRKPRVFAVEVDSESLTGLRARLQADLVASGVTEPDEGRFWPHVTVARVRSSAGSRTKGGPLPVLKAPGTLPAALLDPFDGVRVALYRSDLRPRGAEYVPLARKHLPPTA
ncbi:MAG: RNA 2',3'-cyclic phosphodiesterase [Actinomycetota bacterium]|nr:RNA 2',3'-cyclic phosphodiesterase [Actinomycetota bacterium]